MSRRIWIPIVMSALLAPAWVNAQDQQQGQGQNQERGGDRGGDRGGPGRGGDAAEFRQRMEERLKEQLGTTDDEWKVLQPKLEKVMTARRDTMGGGFGGFGGGRRGDDNNSGSQQRSAVQTASSDLRTTLENKDATPEEINAKLKALRDAREKAKADLAAAQKDLKEVITPRQEAVLVTIGMLE